MNLHSFTWPNKKILGKPVSNRLGAVLVFIILFIGMTKYYLVYDVEERLEKEGYVFCSELIKGRYHREVYQKNSCRA
jgi:hypothetical protein